MEIRQITAQKKRFLDLLLLADEQEEMIDRYLERGVMHVLFDGAEAVGSSVITWEGERLYELKSLAVTPGRQRQGLGRRLVAHAAGWCRAQGGRRLRVGTGETPGTLAFYRAQGFVPCGRIPDFFTQHYDHPIVEEGVRLRDMIVLEMPLCVQETGHID